jgi:hypothetical protein
MSDQHLRNLMIQSQPEVYRAGGDVTSRVDLLEAARTRPHAVLEVFMEDVIWRVLLESLVQDEETPSLAQILSLARQGDFALAHERTQLAFHLGEDKALLRERFLAAANAELVAGDD